MPSSWPAVPAKLAEEPKPPEGRVPGDWRMLCACGHAAGYHKYDGDCIFARKADGRACGCLGWEESAPWVC